MLSIAYGIAVAGGANAIALALKYYFKYKMDKERQTVYINVTQQLVEENSDRIIQAVEHSIKEQVTARIESFYS